MISALRGYHGGMDADGGLIVFVREHPGAWGGVGYRVLVNDRDRDKLNVKGPDGEVSLWCRTFSTENEVTIYGFLYEADRKAFSALLRVDGVGAVTALRLLSVYSCEHLKAYVSSKSAVALTKVPGIGRKTADKVVEQAKL